MLVATIVNNNYSGFAPLFEYGVKKKYPDWECQVFTLEDSGPKIAAKRFTFTPAEYKSHDYILITDIDILFGNEDVIKMRVDFMDKNRLKCYSNSPIDNKNTFPGVHFVTPDWYAKTYYWRRFYDDYINQRELKKDDDERILGDIIYKSSLKMCTPSGQMSHHGFHLGCLRDRIYNQTNLPDAPVIQEYLNDKEFMRIVDNSKCPLVNSIFTKLKTIFNT